MNRPGTEGLASSLAERWSRMVDQLRAGDPAGQEVLYEAFVRGLRFYFSRELPPEDVADKIHDTILAVVEAVQAGRLADPVRLPGYVRAVAHKMLAQHIDDAIRRRGRAGELLPETQVAVGGPTPEQLTWEVERRAIVQKTLEEMEGIDREILVRFYLEEQAAEQICRELQLSETQFRLRKHRAKERLSEKLRKALKRKRLGEPFLVRKKAASGD